MKGIAKKALSGAFLGALALSHPAAAKVERIEILARQPLADGQSFGVVGAYERIDGRLHYALDPALPANQAITDIELAEKDARGKVSFVGDFVLLRPQNGKAGNDVLLYEVDNRGNNFLFQQFNDGVLKNDLAAPGALGDGWLMAQGYSLLWSGWNWDVAQGGDRHQISLPTARNADGSAITGRVGYEFIVDAPQKSSSYLGILAKGYAFADGAEERAELSVRTAPDGARTIIPRDQWRFAKYDAEKDEVRDDPKSVYYAKGFEPGKLYELIYEAKDPVVLGAGLAAIRDAVSFFRYQGADQNGVANPLGDKGGHLPKRALAFGISQSGRAIQTMIQNGLHLDESKRPVWDGAFVHVAGGGKGGFNLRFGQTTRHFSAYEEQLYATDFFPFATVPTVDPATGEKASILDRAHELGFTPKLIYTATSTDYWTRSASLFGTDVEGKRDLGLDPKARYYQLTGAQHIVHAPPKRGIYENCLNPLDYRPQLRAYLAALDDWTKKGKEPPASLYPTIAKGTLVDLEGYLARFPAIPGLRLPGYFLNPPRLDYGPDFAATGVATQWPPIFGEPFKTLVPAPDSDGNDLGGVRAAEIAVPLGSYLPWNLRNEAAGSPDRLARLFGSFIPFAATREERLANGDPRPSLEERYQDRADYERRVREAARALAARGDILSTDVDLVASRAGDFFDRARGRDKSCAYLSGK